MYQDELLFSNISALQLDPQELFTLTIKQKIVKLSINGNSCISLVWSAFSSS